MCKEKNLKCNINKRLINSINKNKLLVISVSKNKQLDVAFHVYVKNNDAVVLWFSCSSFRNNNSDKNLVGRINRYQHFEDITYFWQRNIRYYDWGGVKSFDNPCGIDQFKYSFPGEKTYVYSKTVAATKKGALFLKIKKILRK